jgi:hypothetical protein
MDETGTPAACAVACTRGISVRQSGDMRAWWIHSKHCAHAPHGIFFSGLLHDPISMALTGRVTDERRIETIPATISWVFGSRGWGKPRKPEILTSQLRLLERYWYTTSSGLPFSAINPTRSSDEKYIFRHSTMWSLAGEFKHVTRKIIPLIFYPHKWRRDVPPKPIYQITLRR